MKNRRSVIITIAVLVVAVVSFVSYTYVQQRSFRVASTSPSNKSKGASTTGGVSITFSQTLRADAPYTLFSIQPKTDGKIAVSGKTITFTPDGQLRPNTLYYVIVEGAASATSTLDAYTFSFTTGDQKLSDFEKSLPYTTNDYTIDRLANGTIVVIPITYPASASAQLAMDFLKSKGVDTSKVLVQKAASASD